MLIENQNIYMKWNSKNKKTYTSILDENGNPKYIWTGVGQEFKIDVEDISKQSKIKIDVKCDYCGNIIQKTVANYYKNKKANKIPKDACRKCSGLKIRENLGTLNDEYYEETNNDNNYTKEFLISEFFRFKKEFGRYPKSNDLKCNPDFPSLFGYKKYWGNFKAFFNDLKIIDEDDWFLDDVEILKEYYTDAYSIKTINLNLMYKRTIYEIEKKIDKLKIPNNGFLKNRHYDTTTIETTVVKALLDLSEDLNKIPTAKEYDDYLKLNKLPNRKRIESILGKSYRLICEEHLGSSNKKEKSNNELLSDLYLLKEKLGRTPLTIDLIPNGLCEAKAYTRRFNMTFNELLHSLGWELSSSELKLKSKRELLDDFFNLYIKTNRIPTYSDIDNNHHMSSSRTYIKHFGSVENISLELGIDMLDDNHSSKGFITRNKNNELCRSLVELNISNMLIDNNIKYTPELKYKELNNNLLNKWRMDWYLDEHGICVEYFGLYDEKHLNRRTLLGKYSRKVKKKIKFCEENNIQLISIYKEDLNNDYEGLLVKFNQFGINLNIYENMKIS